MNNESSFYEMSVESIVAQLENYSEELKKKADALRQTLPHDHPVVRSSSPERQSLIETLKRFLDDVPLVNFIKGALEGFLALCATSPEGAMQKTTTFWNFMKEKESIYMEFCCGQQKMDAWSFTAKVESFLEHVGHLIKMLHDCYEGSMHQMVTADLRWGGVKEGRKSEIHRMHIAPDLL